MISNAQWDLYKGIINNAHNYFNQDTVIWRRFVRGLQRYGEDNASNEATEDITLKVLILYNSFRTWPITEESVSGITDKQNMVLMINKSYLNGLGYLNGSGFFDINPGRDIFIHMGEKYRASGETPVGQAKDDPLHFFIVLKREESLTGEDKY